VDNAKRSTAFCLQERYTPQLPPDRYDLYWVPKGK